MTDLKQAVEQTASAVKTEAEVEVAKKVNTFGNTLKDNATVVAIYVIGIALALGVFLAIELL